VRAILAALVLCLAAPAVAEGVAQSPRPPANPRLIAAPAPEAPQEPAVAAVPAEGAVMAQSLRPMPRPRALAERIAGLKAASNAPGLDLSTDQSGGDIDLATIAPPSKKEERRKKREAASMKGAVCGVSSIKGEEIGPIRSNVKGCGVEDAVRVTSVGGVELSQAVTVDCSVVQGLDTWVKKVAQPAFDGKLVRLQIAAHYICRSRNNIKGAKISEHGKGRAIDIAGFVLSNGTVLTVADNYNRTLRRIYKAACSIFRTTLGPGSDGYHENHFHFDTSARSGGAYCR
jgi:hypothetical protein